MQKRLRGHGKLDALRDRVGRCGAAMPSADSHTSGRRAALMALASAPLLGAKAAGAGDDQAAPPRSRTLVAYFSRSGNTRVVAGLIHRALGADLFEIVPAMPYPEDYLETVDMARQERDAAKERPLANRVRNIDSYDTVYLGHPIWGETIPPTIRAFLAAHDLSGKKLIPFVTHGGYGLGSSQRLIARLAPQAKLQAPFVMEADQERRTMNEVNRWLDTTAAKK
nr:flavodoxin [uncultured Duganella sp.]